MDKTNAEAKQTEENNDACEVPNPNEENMVDPKYLDELREYLDDMAFKLDEDKLLKKPDPFIERMAEPHPRRVSDTCRDYKDVLSPKSRAERFKRRAAGPCGYGKKMITTEELENILQEQRARESNRKKNFNKRQKVFHSILKKLENQCRDQIMTKLVEKFATFMSKKCSEHRNPPVLTEGVQNLTRGLVCNMFISLGIHERPCKADQTLFETVALVLADMILETLYQSKTHSFKSCYHEKDSEQAYAAPKPQAQPKPEETASTEYPQREKRKDCSKLSEGFQMYMEMKREFDRLQNDQIKF